MQIVLVGYPGSQKIVPATKYLLDKYMPGFPVLWLNHTDDIRCWSTFVKHTLQELPDERVIFALDDYLITDHIDMEKFNEALTIQPCVKLHYTTEQEHKEYPVTTQYTIWDRKELIELLCFTSTPWDFEMRGSELFRGSSVVYSCLRYDTSSVLSPRWEGVNLTSLKPEDLIEVNKLI